MSKRKASSPLDKKESPLKKQKTEEICESPTIFSLDGLLGISNTIVRSRLNIYQSAVEELTKHNNRKGGQVHPKLKSVAEEATRDIEDIKKSEISIAIVGSAGQGKSTFGNRFLWNKEGKNFPLITSDVDHKTSRSVYCKTSGDKKWRAQLRVTPDPIKESTPQFRIVAVPEVHDEESMREFLEDPRCKCSEEVPWDSVVSIHLEGPFELDKGVTIIDTPGWNFNFGPDEDEKPLRLTIKQALTEASVLILLSIAPRIQGKEDIQTLLEKIPLRDEPPVIVPAWACNSAPDRSHAERIRHALQTLKSDTSLGKLNDGDDPLIAESASDPWERYQIFDQMIQRTLLFTVPYSFNHLRQFVEQLKDKYAHPKFVKIHWAFKTFTFLSKRDEKTKESVAVRLAGILEVQHNDLMQSEWEEEQRIKDCVDDMCEKQWNDMLIIANPSNEQRIQAQFRDSLKSVYGHMASLRRVVVFSYTKVFIDSVEKLLGNTITKRVTEDEDSDLEDTPQEIINNEYYKFLEENFQRGFTFAANRKTASSAFARSFKAALSFKDQIAAIYQTSIPRLNESPTFEIDEEIDGYVALRAKFMAQIRKHLQKNWEAVFTAVKSSAGASINNLLELLRLKDNLGAIANCLNDVKLNVVTVAPPKTPLTAKDPLVHIFKYSDFSSELEKGIATVKRRNKKPNKPWTLVANKNERSQNDQIIIASQFVVKSGLKQFTFDYSIGKDAVTAINELREKLSTAASMVTLFPIFVICPVSNDPSWQKSKDSFSFASLEPETLNNQLLIFMVMPKAQYKTYENLIQTKALSDACKKRVYFVLLDTDDDVSAALYLDVIKVLAESWKIDFYWRISLNVFHPMKELDLANFRRRKISLARGLLLMQNMVHNYRFSVAQEFSKVLREKKVNQAVARVIGRSDVEKYVDVHTLVRDRTPFVSFAELVELVRILEECIVQQDFTSDSDKEKRQTLENVVVKFTELLQKFSVICAVDYKTLDVKLAACFPYLFDIDSTKGTQIKFLSLNNTFAQRQVVSRSRGNNDLVKPKNFREDLIDKEKELAEQCVSLHKALMVVTPYVMLIDAFVSPKKEKLFFL